MDTSLTVEYDKAGDILYLGKTKPYPEQDSEELDYGVVARLNPQTRDLENLEILFSQPEDRECTLSAGPTGPAGSGSVLILGRV